MIERSNKLLRDAAYKIDDPIWFAEKNAGSFAPARRGKGRFEVYRNDFFQQRYETLRDAKAYVASCVADGGKLSEFVVRGNQ